MSWRVAVLCVSLAAGYMQVPGGVRAQRELPPVSYVCPMSEHMQVLEDKPGKCPLCSMVLVPVRIDQAFSCPTHPAVISDRTGTCPLDKRELMPVTVAVFWTCADKPQEHLTEPGKCADGTTRKAVREQRAHGDHNPRHGGQFFMAGDKWHHVEATYPRAGFLRVYVYDNFTKPIDVKAFSGRAVTTETFDTKTVATREIEVTPLLPSRDRQTFEAKINAKTLPARVTLKMKFDPRLAEERFDFTFEGYSKEPSVPASTAAPRGVAPPAPAVSSAAAPAPAAPGPSQMAPMVPVVPQQPPGSSMTAPATVSPPDVGRFAEALPRTSGELLGVLATGSKEVDTLIQQGQFGAVYVPAMLAKNVALALDDHAIELPEARRAQAMNAIKRVVVAAWQLDAYADLGNREKLSEAHRAFTAAVGELSAAYAR